MSNPNNSRFRYWGQGDWGLFFACMVGIVGVLTLTAWVM